MESTESDVRRLGPQIETHPMFPNRINVQFLEVAARDHIRIRIWERGAGYTLASGSSSCAAASAARRLGLVDDHVRVEMPGGDIDINFAVDGHVRMTGDIRSTIDGVVTADLASTLRTEIARLRNTPADRSNSPTMPKPKPRLTHIAISTAHGLRPVDERPRTPPMSGATSHVGEHTDRHQ